MYQQTKEKLGNVSFDKFHNPNTGCGFSVVPQLGACLLDVWMEEQSMLDGHQTEAELLGNNYFKNTILAPFPNRLKGGQYSCHGKQYQFPINDEANQTALHGMVYAQNFEIKNVQLDASECRVELAYAYDGHLTYYPFPFLLTINYIQTKNNFDVIIKCKNLHTQSIPMGLGWHPYFQMQKQVNDLYLKMPKVEKILIDEQMIPNGELETFSHFTNKTKIENFELDNAFLIAEKDKERVEVVLSSATGQMVYTQQLRSNTNNYLQVFTPPDRKSIAIEPMTCNIDAFNNDEPSCMLAPNEELQLDCSFAYVPIHQKAVS